MMNIYFETEILSWYFDATWRGHLDKVYHIISYLNRYNRSKLVFYAIQTVFGGDRFAKLEWGKF